MAMYAKLRGRIVEKYHTQRAFAEALGISGTELSHILTGRHDLKLSRSKRMCELLEIEPADIPSYFFND